MRFPPNPTDEGIAKLNQLRIFARDALPCEWLIYAEELHDAAAALWNDSGNTMSVNMEPAVDGSALLQKSCGHSRTFILLAGLALENVLKGLIIAKDPSLVNEGALAKSLQNHNLTILASAVKELRLSKQEEHVLAVCQDAIPYWGRYPIPLRYADLQPKEALTQEFRESFDSLCHRLCRALYDQTKDGWDSGVGPKTLQVRSTRYGDEIDLKQRFPWANDDG